MDWQDYLDWCGEDANKMYAFHVIAAKVFFDTDKEDIKMLGGERLYIANKKARKHMKLMNTIIPSWFSPEKEHGLSRKTRVRCSCSMCGHRREMEGLPIREIRMLPLPEELE